MTDGTGGSLDDAPRPPVEEGEGNNAGARPAATGGFGRAGPPGARSRPGATEDRTADGPADGPGSSGGDGSVSDAVHSSLADRVNADLAADLAAAVVDEDLQLATVARERDDYLDALRRLQADFENYKKRMLKQQHEQTARAAEALVNKLLPVCDTADLAIAHGGGEEVKQVWTALFDALEHEGLERIDPVGVPFDPTVHEAVAHEPSDGAHDPEVVEVMRAGYRWKGRVLRPAMVKVRG